VTEPWSLRNAVDPMGRSGADSSAVAAGSTEECSLPSDKRVKASGGSLERAMLLRPSMVRLTVGVSAASARGADELLDAFHSLVIGTRLERGCVQCSAWMEPDSSVHYVEEWATEPDMRKRVQSTGFTSVLAVVESAREADVHFDFVSQTRGLDYVAEVRSKGA
jgi:quinol monooxygenase YgiN